MSDQTKSQNGVMLRKDSDGGYSYPPPPESVDVMTADRDTLLQYGIIMPNLETGSAKHSKRALDSIIRRTLKIGRWISPRIVSGPGFNHLRANSTASANTSNNWCGYAIKADGPWSSVSAYINVPGADFPAQAPANLDYPQININGPTYSLSAWVGMDGVDTDTNDVLQCGYYIIANPENRQVMYLPFYEWIVHQNIYDQNGNLLGDLYDFLKDQFPYVAEQFLFEPDLLSPGDGIYAAAQYRPQGDGGIVTILNSTKNWVYTKFLPTPITQVDGVNYGASYNGNSVEWIVERIDGANGVMPASWDIRFHSLDGAAQDGQTGEDLFYEDAGSTWQLTPNAGGYTCAMAYPEQSLLSMDVVWQWQGPLLRNPFPGGRPGDQLSGPGKGSSS
jgi:hypothetical protein